MKKIVFAAFLFLSLLSGFTMAGQVLAERDVVVTPAPPRAQTARAVEIRPVTTQPAPVVKKPVVSPVVPPVVKVLQAPTVLAKAQPERKAVTPTTSAPSPQPMAVEKREVSRPQGPTSFFQGLLDRWFPKR